MATTPDSHAGGPGFKSPTNFGAHLLYTPPSGRKDASRVPKRDGVRESRAPEMTKKIYADFFYEKPHLTCISLLAGTSLIGPIAASLARLATSLQE